ncbi:uncharacterized protein LOC132795084 isoform X1 [Drosophila nasuta]|uniref:uncharacterized protein LOC132795084 isoform X1 n=1 Tax=Drosophila nasuta TaxID=42062 RepID=UPI00295E5627|nr:uncharacterized protein LOC132795084 isoform X1 [Drosophila nasuta]
MEGRRRRWRWQQAGPQQQQHRFKLVYSSPLNPSQVFLRPFSAQTKRKELNPITTRKSTKAAVEKITIVVPNNILIVIVIVVIVLLFFLVLCTTPAGENDINLTPPKQLTLTLTLPLLLQFLAALVQLLLVTTNFKSELHHMLCDLTIQRHTVAITYDLSETPAKKGAPPIPQKRSKSFELCMNSKRRTISHRTSSNRHRKLQPFRYT